MTIGKTLGAGIPCAAHGMSADVAQRVHDRIDWHNADVGGVGGTLTGNTLFAGGDARDARPDPDRRPFARMVDLGARFEQGCAT
ncbi:MAG TPA: hypothetical protein VK923_00725 [Euzebyales bacterium]|nr:hypothetical protein [Euzebyales bacterium]